MMSSIQESFRIVISIINEIFIKMRHLPLGGVFVLQGGLVVGTPDAVKESMERISVDHNHALLS